MVGGGAAAMETGDAADAEVAGAAALGMAFGMAAGRRQLAWESITGDPAGM